MVYNESMVKSLLNQLRSTTDYKLIDITLLDPTTRRVIHFLKSSNDDFTIRLESSARLIGRDLLLNGSASTSTGTEKLAVVRQFQESKPATFHIYRNGRKDLTFTKQVADMIKPKEAQPVRRRNNTVRRRDRPITG